MTQRQQQQRLLQQQLQSHIKESTSPPPQTPAANNVQGKVVAVVPVKGKPVSTVVATAATALVKSPDPRQRTSRINGARTPLQQTTPLQAQTQTLVQPQAQAQTQTLPQVRCYLYQGQCSITRNHIRDARTDFC